MLDIGKIEADIAKLMDNTMEISRNTMEIHRDTMRISREPWWHTWLMAIVCMGLGAILAKTFS